MGSTYDCLVVGKGKGNSGSWGQWKVYRRVYSEITLLLVRSMERERDKCGGKKLVFEVFMVLERTIDLNLLLNKNTLI